MKYAVIPTQRFIKDLDFYYRKKKYKKIERDVLEITEQLEDGKLVGEEIEDLHISIDESVYKVRTVNSSINVGKSNGFRIIYYVVKNDYEIYLLTIYSKKDKENISVKEIKRLIEMYCI